MPECLSAGIIVADHVCEPVSHMPAPGELILSPHMELTVGGCASNMAVDLAYLGSDVAIVGRIGGDVFGEFVQRKLEQSGVDCNGLVRSSTSETSGSLVINVDGEDRRFIHTLGANAEFDGSEVTDELLRSSKVLYLGGYLLMESLSPSRAAELFRKARSMGIQTVLDVVIPAPGEYWSALEPVLSETDFFLPNDDEAALITGLQSPIEQAQAFRDRGASTVLITCGANGCLVHAVNQRFQASAIPTEVIDGTGSGDAFVAGFIYGLLHEKALRDCVLLGTGLGARTVASLGATGAAVTANELAEFVSDLNLNFRDLSSTIR